ncbi:MAG: DUF58 domain-containing protein [Lachnospiraceae bacterium]|nr:DUF58 domain-containing protein [Lachnospiraceae bacterium]
MKIHIWSIIRYLFLLILIVFFVLVFKQNYLVFLLFPYVLLPAVLIPLFIINVKKISIKGGSVVESTEVGNNIVFYTEYVNPTYYPFLKCSLTFSMNNLFFKADKDNLLNINVLPKKTDRVNISVRTSAIGMVVFEGKGMTVTGFMGMVSMKLPVSFNVQVPVFPEKKENVDVAEIPYSEGYDEYTEPDLKGNLSSDIKEIREYRPGDRLARIHWKLTAKMEELQVKEMERTSVMSLVVVPELERSQISSTVSTLDAVSRELANRGERFEICLYNSVACSFDNYIIDNEESLLICYRDMYYLPLYEGAESAKEAYYASNQKSALLLSVYGESVKLLEDGIEIDDLAEGIF